MSTKVSQIKTYTNGAWQDITKVHDGSGWKNFRGVYANGVWYELSTCQKWNLECYSYNNVSVSLQSYIAAGATFFKNDGTELYQFESEGTTSFRVYVYLLSTAWDLSTIDADSYSVYSYVTGVGIEGVFIKSDGTLLYIVGYNNPEIQEIPINTSWDMSTLDVGNMVTVSSHSSDFPYGVYLNDGGTKLYEADRDGSIYEHLLSTEWDLSTISYNNASVNCQSSSDINGVNFSSDGTKMYEVSDKTYQYTLSTAWDLSTASYDGITFNHQIAQVQNMNWNPDGNRMYHFYTDNRTIYENIYTG